MTAEGLDNFAYEPARSHESEAARRHYWAVAIGLQRVDGLEVSPYVREAATSYVGGERTLEEVGRLVRAYHGDAACSDPNAATREADLVAQRNARYFRDALVRAMYRNAAAGVFPDESFLVAFYENALGRGHHKLNREDLICTAFFENPSLIRNVDPSEALDKRSAGL